MDYTDKYELDVKAGNRLGRRLRTTLGRIGQAASTLGSRTEPFDPNAYDGDGDGVIQDGSQWERPAIAQAQTMPSLPESGDPLDPDKDTDLADELSDEMDASSPKPEVEGGATGDTEQDVEEDVQRRRIAEQLLTPDEATTEDGIDQEGRRSEPSNSRSRDGFERMTPRAFAEYAVPDDYDTMIERAVDGIAGDENQYESREAYEKAREIVEVAIRNSTELSIGHHNRIEELYDAKYGTGAFLKDLNEDRQSLRERMAELIGSSSIQYAFMTDVPYGQDRPIDGVNPDDFIRIMAKDQNIPKAKRDLYAAILEKYDLPPNESMHQIWAHVSGGQVLAPPVSMFFRLLGDILIGDSRRHLGQALMIRPNRLSLPMYIDGDMPLALQGIEGSEIAKQVMKDYWAWAEKQPNAQIFKLERDGTINGIPTDEQIEARIEIASTAPNISKALPYLFPGSVGIVPDGRAYSFSFVRNDGPQVVFDKFSPSFLPNDIQKMRNIIEKLLIENPAVLRQWQRFGVPTIQFLHPLNSVRATYVARSLPANAVGKKDNTTKLLFKHFLKSARRAMAFDGNDTPQKRKKLFGEMRKLTKFQRAITQNEDARATLNMLDDLAILGNGVSAAGVGGFYNNSMGIIMVDPYLNDIALAKENEVANDIISLTDSDSITSMGEGATIVHEWAHSIHDRITAEARIIIGARAQELYDEKIANGESERSARKARNDFIKNAKERYGLGLGFGDYSHLEYFNELSEEELGTPLPRSAVPRFRQIYDYSKYSEYGFSSKREMEDFILEQLLTMKESGYQPGGLLEYATLDLDYSDPRYGRAKKLADKNGLNSPEPYVRSPYGQSKWTERWPEAVTGVLLQMMRKRPFWVNDAMLRLVQNILMERDSNGPLVEKHGITSLSRRGRDENGNPTDEMQDISNSITSTEVPIVPDEIRLSDGHRAKNTLRSSSRSLRFDPDERSRMRSGRSNIGLDTDERLYAFEEPVSSMDSRGRARLFTIGDHRFYDDSVPYAQSWTRARRAVEAQVAGARIIDRKQPHHGDVVRAISATQFGLFVDDMPTYDTTLEYHREILRAVVSGRVRSLGESQRRDVEQAVRDAFAIQSHIASDATPTSVPLYRPVNVDANTFLAGVRVGDVVPMPITLFSRSRPKPEESEAVVRLEKGALAALFSDDTAHFATQGNFEVVSLSDENGQLVMNLRHVEVFDPRHDAMRPASRENESPSDWRRMGSPTARYTASEQQRITTDRARRRDHTAIAFNSLRSSGGGGGYVVEVDKEIDELIEQRSSAAETARVLIRAMRNKISTQIREQTNKRLDVGRKAITDKYGTERPWEADADAVRRFSSLPTRAVNDVFERLNNSILAALADGDEEFGLRRPEDILKVVFRASTRDREFLNWQMTRHIQSSTNSTSLRKLLDTGLMEVYGGDGKVMAHVPILLSNDEREILKSIVNMSDVIERAYLTSAETGREIDIESGTLRTIPHTDRGQSSGGVRIEFLLKTSSTDRNRLAFNVNSRVVHSQENGKDIDAGFFERKVSMENGQLVIEHKNMNLNGMQQNLGAATVLNQHSFQWWRQIPSTNVILFAAMDGPIVWPRHGFHPKEGRARRFDFDEVGVNFETLINAISHVLMRTSKDKNTRKRTVDSGADMMWNALIDVRVDSEGRLVNAQSAAQIAERILGRNTKKPKEVELDDATKAFRERLGFWLALAIQDRYRTTESRKGTLVLLANLLDTSTMSEKQKSAWRELFSSVYDGGYTLELDGIDNDPDFLPSFVISDDDPAAGKVQRGEIIRRERERGARQDMFISRRTAEDVDGQEIDSRDESRTEQAASRLFTVFTSTTASEAMLEQYEDPFDDRDLTSEFPDPESAQVQIAREIAGYESLPRLMTTEETEINAKKAVNYGKVEIRPAIDDDGKRESTIVVGIPQNGRMSYDSGLIVDSIRSFLRGNRSGIWNELDEHFWGGHFTTTPGEYAGRFVDIDDPTIDPATTPHGMIGVTEPWARWTSRDLISETSETADTIIQDLIGDEIDDRMSFVDVAETLSDAKIFVNGAERNLYEEKFVNGNTRWMLNNDFFSEYIEENHGQLSTAQKDDLRAIFSLLGDMQTMSNSRGNVSPFTSWVAELVTRNDNDRNDSRKRMLLATILGYDILDETAEGELRSRIEILNRTAVKMNDEAVSLQQIQSLSGMSVAPVNPRVSLRSAGVTQRGQDGVLLSSPIQVDKATFRSYSYRRSVRQDFGVELPRRSLRSSGNPDIYDRSERHIATRASRRKASSELTGQTPKEYREILNQRAAEHDRLTSEIERLEELDSELTNQLDDLMSSGRINDETEKSINAQIDDIQAQQRELEIQQEEIQDLIASEVNGMNEILDKALSRHGMKKAILAFMDDEASVDIPQSYRDKLNELLVKLEAMDDIPDLSEIASRHKAINELLEDNFDIRWGVEKDGGYNRKTEFDGATLEEFDPDELDEPADEWLEWVYRGFFDPEFENWKDGRAERVFDGFISRMEEAGLPKKERSESRKIQDLFDEVVSGITHEERRQWAEKHDEYLNDEYNADYEESLIDATPSSQTQKPNGMPDNTWRKVKALIKLARRTPFEGERRNATELAKRLLEQHRPDLANDNYIGSLRSSGKRTLPTINGINFSRTTLNSRGAPPERPTTPRSERTHALIAESLQDVGYEVEEADLLPDGKYGPLLAQVFYGESAINLDEIMANIENADRGFEYMPPISDRPYTQEEIRVMKAIITEAAKVALRKGWGTTEIEGHRIKKVNGPLDDRVADVLMDESDLALIRSMGSATAPMLAEVIAGYHKEVNRLNKIFGAYESRDVNGTVYRVGAAIKGKDSAFQNFMTSLPVEDPSTKKMVWMDVRSTPVMSLKNDTILRGRPTSSGRPGHLLGAIFGNFGAGLSRSEQIVAMSEPSSDGPKTNDVIFEAMFDAAGISYTDLPEAPKGGLTQLRRQVEWAKSMLETFEFAPTPAGRHMQDMFTDRIKEGEQLIEMSEKIGQRFVQIMRESGVRDSEIPEKLKKAASNGIFTVVFENGSATGDARQNVTMLEQALYAHMRMTLGSPFLPRYTDAPIHIAGTHEIGHFVLGQGFTRHGEFMANFWPLAVYGRHMWRVFAETQSQQSRFDVSTLREFYGRSWNAEQKRLYNSLSEETKKALYPIVTQLNDGVLFRQRDLNDMTERIVADIENDPDLTDIEKAEIISTIRAGEQAAEGTIGEIRHLIYGGQSTRGITDDDFLERLEEAKQRDLTQEVMDRLKIVDYTRDDVDPLDMPARINVQESIDPFVPLSPELFGWRRTSEGSTLRSSGTLRSGGKTKVAKKFTKVSKPRTDGRPGRDISDSDFEEDFPDEVKQAQSLLKQAFEYFSTLSEEDLELFANYIGESFDLNTFLRTGEVPERWFSRSSNRQELIETAERMKEILENAPRINKSMVLYRGLGDIDIDAYEALVELGVGGEFSDNGIISTSWDPNFAENFMARQYDSYGIPMLEVIVPKGSRALSIIRPRQEEDDFFPEDKPIGVLHGLDIMPAGEREILLPPATRFKIVAIIDTKDVNSHDGRFRPRDGADRPKIIVEVIP
jgi:hypothetical protein